jgi:hypothetical protein
VKQAIGIAAEFAGLAPALQSVARPRLMVARGQVLTLIGIVCGGLAAAHAQAPARPGSAKPTPAKPTPAKPAAPAVAPALVGAQELMTLTPAAGFIDDIVGHDAARIAYVVADGAARAELRVVQIGCPTCAEKQQELIVDLAAITLRPLDVRLVGNRALVIGQNTDGSHLAALLELGQRDATPVYSLGPAAHITVITRGGKPQLAVHKVSPARTGTRHDVELYALDTGKRTGAGKPFELDAADRHTKLDFQVNHWGEGQTLAIGIKGGEWNKKANMRSPDTEATYDLITGKFVETRDIADLFEQRKRYQLLAELGDKLDLVRMAWDNSAIEVWRAGRPQPVTLDQPLSLYDGKSVQGVVLADGTAWIALKVDPVNPTAIARKKADVEYLDVFRVGADGSAVRKARVPSVGLRHRFGVIGEGFWLLERSTGFDRGGRKLTLYRLP